MTTRKRRAKPPIALLWTRADQRRFVDTVERLHSVLGDLVLVVEEMKRERLHGRRPTSRTSATRPNSSGSSGSSPATPDHSEDNAR